MGLGIVLTPNGLLPNGAPPYAIDYAYKGATSWFGSNSANDAPGVANADPHQDPQFLTHGEQGYYYDTPLGRPSGMRGLGVTLGRSSSLRGILPPMSIGAAMGMGLAANIAGGIYGYKRAERRGTKKFWPTVGFAILGSMITTAGGYLLGLLPAKASAGVSGFPTDFQLATRRQYLPVESGWIPLKDNKILTSGPWIPPSGQGGHYDPRFPVPVISVPTNDVVGAAGVSGLRGLRDASTAPPVTASVPGSSTNVDDVIGVMTEHNDRAFSLALVSTTAVAVSALLGVFRTLKLIREDSSRD